MKTKLMLSLLVAMVLFSCKDKESNIVPEAFRIQVIDENHGQAVPNAKVRFHKMNSGGLAIGYSAVAEITTDENGELTTTAAEWNYAQAIAPGYMENTITQMSKPDLYSRKKIGLVAELTALIRVLDNPDLNEFISCRFIPIGSNTDSDLVVHAEGNPEIQLQCRCAEGRQSRVSVHYINALGESVLQEHSIIPISGQDNELIIQY